MGQWRRAWYSQAPTYTMVLKTGGGPNAMDALVRMTSGQIQAMRMMGSLATPENRLHWFLVTLLHHHGGALIMAHDALNHCRNAAIRRLARAIIVAQRQKILQLRRMLQQDEVNKPEDHPYDRFFSLN